MYIDLLIKIKNAQEAEKKSLKTPFAKMDLTIAELLLKHGFLKNVEAKGKLAKQTIEIDLKDEKAIKGLKIISRPSRRLYSGCKDIKRLWHGGDFHFQRNYGRQRSPKTKIGRSGAF